MSSELIITSVPNGLFPGTYGFCAVACTENMNERARQALNSVSGYRRVSEDRDKNPISYSHYIYDIGGKKYDVLARIADAGVDYTRRTNKLAQFHVFDEGEARRYADPATMCFEPKTFRAWNVDDEPRFLEPHDFPQYNELDASSVANGAWKRLTGDAGWAGVLAATVVTRQQAIVIVPQGMDVTPLIREAIAVLPPELRWKATFSTYYMSTPPNVQCQWKTLIDGTYDVKLLNVPNTLKIDLRDPNRLGSADALKNERNGAYIEIAHGKRVMLGDVGGFHAQLGKTSDFDENLLIMQSVDEDKKQRKASRGIPVSYRNSDYNIQTELEDYGGDQAPSVYRPKQKNNTALWVGIGVIGGVTLTCVVGLVLLFVFKASQSENAEVTETETAVEAPVENTDAEKTEVEAEENAEAATEESEGDTSESEVLAEDTSDETTEASEEVATETTEPNEEETVEETADEQESETAEGDNETAETAEEVEPELPKHEWSIADFVMPWKDSENETNEKKVEQNVSKAVEYLKLTARVNALFKDVAEMETFDGDALVKLRTEIVELPQAADGTFEKRMDVADAKLVAEQAITEADACMERVRGYYQKVFALNDKDKQKQALARVNLAVGNSNSAAKKDKNFPEKMSAELAQLADSKDLAGSGTFVTAVIKAIDEVYKAPLTESVKAIEGLGYGDAAFSELSLFALDFIYKDFIKNVNDGKLQCLEPSKAASMLKRNFNRDAYEWKRVNDKYTHALGQAIFEEGELTAILLSEDSHVRFKSDENDDKNNFEQCALKVEKDNADAQFSFDVYADSQEPTRVKFFIRLKKDGDLVFAVSDNNYLDAIAKALRLQFCIEDERLYDEPIFTEETPLLKAGKEEGQETSAPQAADANE